MEKNIVSENIDQEDNELFIIRNCLVHKTYPLKFSKTDKNSLRKKTNRSFNLQGE